MKCMCVKTGRNEGQCRWDSLERKHVRQDSGVLDMYGGNMMGIVGYGCGGWNC